MKNIEPKKEVVKSQRELMQEFIKKYQLLCKEYGLQIVVTPAFKAMKDTGTFNVVLQTSIGKISNK
jgi:hypothetical protein